MFIVMSSLWFSSNLFFPVFMLVSFLYFLFERHLVFLQDLSHYTVLVDEFALFLVFITVFVLFVSYLFAIQLQATVRLSITMVAMYLFCVAVFTMDRIFLLYLFYEASLLPILYIIIKWGSYPERSLRGLMLLLYTSVFTFPFLFIIFMFFYENSSFSFSIFGLVSNSVTDLSLFPYVVFLTFAVKLPLYGLHFWLPMAHVEAPTFGRIILAGVLLKLGGIGLIRFSVVTNYSSLYSSLVSYFIFSTLLVTIVCCFQSDFKRLVAYSSVSHMMAIPFLILANTSLRRKSLVSLILFHGLSSPLLFMLVGILYFLFQTRQLVFMRGIILSSPVISMLIVLAFFFTLSAPPFPSFISEVAFMTSALYLTKFLIPIFFLFAFFSLLYNLN